MTSDELVPFYRLRDVPVSDSGPSDGPLPRDAWAALASERAALDPRDLVPFNVDPRSAAIVAFGSYPKLLAMEPLFLDAIPGFDPHAVVRLPLYAGAAYHAETLYEIASKPPEDPVALHVEALEVRRVLRTDLAPLVRRGLVQAARLRAIRGTIGYQGVASELSMLAVLLGEVLEGRPRRGTACTEAELEHAVRLGQRLSRAAGRREKRSTEAREADDDRRRALTLLVRKYDALRRMVAYVRWEAGDAERVAPSLFAHARKRKRAPAPVLEPNTEPADGGSSVNPLPAENLAISRGSAP